MEQSEYCQRDTGRAGYWAGPQGPSKLSCPGRVDNRSRRGLGPTGSYRCLIKVIRELMMIQTEVILVKVVEDDWILQIF